MIRLDPLMLNCSSFGQEYGLSVGKSVVLFPAAASPPTLSMRKVVATADLLYMIVSSRCGLIPDGRDCFFNSLLDRKRTPAGICARKKRFKVIGGIEIAIFASGFAKTLVNDADHAVSFGGRVGDDFVHFADGQAVQWPILFR